MKLASTLPLHATGTPTEEAVADVDAKVELSRELGYEYVEMGDTPHVPDASFNFQNVPTLGRASASFDHLAGFFIAPLYDPIYLAEAVSALASFVDQFDLWCAIGGPAREAEYDAFGIPTEDRAARFEEQLELLQSLWEGEGVTYDGDFYDVDEVRIEPATAPSRVCIGGSARPAVRRAGSRGDAWVVSPSEEKSGIERKLRWFEDAGGGEVIVRRNALVLDDAADARAVARREIGDTYRGLPIDNSRVITGSVADAVDELRDLRDLGVDEVVVRPIGRGHAVRTFKNVARAAEEL